PRIGVLNKKQITVESEAVLSGEHARLGRWFRRLAEAIFQVRESETLSPTPGTGVLPGIAQSGLFVGYLMPEVADTGEDHSHVPLVGDSDHFVIANRTARLNGAGRARISCRDETVREWKEGVTGNGAPFQGKPGLRGFPDGDAGCIHPRHLAGTDAEG